MPKRVSDPRKQRRFFGWDTYQMVSYKSLVELHCHSVTIKNLYLKPEQFGLSTGIRCTLHERLV